jgi:hypothetical protein
MFSALPSESEFSESEFSDAESLGTSLRISDDEEEEEEEVGPKFKVFIYNP